MSFIVAIDGPAGTGKGTVTRLVAEHTGLINIDTGAMYRCVTLACIKQGINAKQEEKVREILKEIEINLIHEKGMQKVLLNGQDVSEEIRTKEVDSHVAEFAKMKEVRENLTPMQRKMGKENDVIMEGRDIGTVVFPDADIKIYLDCSLAERARRRYEQNLEKGIQDSYEDVLKSMIERHKLETEREIAPFVKAEDAITIDTTHMSIEEVVNQIEEMIRRKRND